MTTRLSLLALPTLLAVMGCGEPTGAGAPVDADLTRLCAQPGVVVCQGFDTEAEATASGQLVAGAAGAPRIDDAVFLEGGGALRIDVAGRTPANAGGDWRITFPAIGVGKSLYLHYAIRYDQDYVDVNSRLLTGTGAKQFILWNGSSSCASMEISHSTLYGRGYPWLYTACGGGGFDIPLPGGDYLIMQGSGAGAGYNCHYHRANDAGLGCPAYQADVWWRFYLKVEIDQLGGSPCAGNVVESWWKKGDGDWVQAVNHPDACLRFNRDANDGFNHLMLTAYMTAKPATVDHPTMSVWYDDLVLSTEPLIDGIDQPTPDWPPLPARGPAAAGSQ
ncbi:MAG: hypothetical protein AB7S39_04225 [Gemmatimonadales bacterium]